MEQNELMEEKGKQEPEKKKRNKWWLLLLLLLLLLGAGGAAFYYRKQAQKPEELNKWQMDQNALEGFLPGKTAEEIQAELSRIIDENTMNVSMNAVPTVRDGKINVSIENVPGNNYWQQVDLYIYPDKNHEQEQELIYQSGLVKPGFYVESGEVLKDLEPGEYDGRAIFHAIYPETGEIVNAPEMTVVVKVEN